MTPCTHQAGSNVKSVESLPMLSLAFGWRPCENGVAIHSIEPVGKHLVYICVIITPQLLKDTKCLSTNLEGRATTGFKVPFGPMRLEERDNERLRMRCLRWLCHSWWHWTGHPCLWAFYQYWLEPKAVRYIYRHSPICVFYVFIELDISDVAVFWGFFEDFSKTHVVWCFAVSLPQVMHILASLVGSLTPCPSAGLASRWTPPAQRRCEDTAIHHKKNNTQIYIF